MYITPSPLIVGAKRPPFLFFPVNIVRIAGALLAWASGDAIVAHAANEPRFVPNVVSQFNALTVRPDPIGFGIGASPNPSSCKHYQGIVRLQASDGTPYFIVSRSGVLPNVPGPDDFGCGDIGTEDDQPGNLLFVRMASRDKFGERMRSNRLRKDRDLTHTPPDPGDTTVAFITFNGETWPNYGHPGGMQLWGDVLAVPLEARYFDELPEGLVQFIDVSDPENPMRLSAFDPGPGVKTGLVGLTQLADGRFLMLLSGGDNDFLWFFESSGPNATNLRSLDIQWTLVSVNEPSTQPGLGGWPSNAHQTLNFLRQQDINGTLYLAGARGGSPSPFTEDSIDLYEVQKVDGEYILIQASSRHLNSHPNADASVLSPGNNTASFAAASGFYVSPSGELIFYATEHDNDGWVDTSIGPQPASLVPGLGTVKAGEWRHVNMVRPGSPTLRPHLTLFPPYEVAEGDATLLTGFARPPITHAWMQLYTDNTFGGRYVVIDHADWAKDSFENFKDLDGSLLDLHAGFDNETSSWRWFTPESCTIRMNDDDINGDGTGSPGAHTLTLHGTGNPEAAANLSQVLNYNGTLTMNDELTSAQFFADCDEYYSTFPELFWDTDRNGNNETIGYVAPFDAADLDGPSEVSARVLAIHPIDGLTTEGAAIVQVFNMPPTITSLRALDSGGHEVGVEVPFVLTNLPVTARATFTDPGKPDHQIASLNWGHGLGEPNSDFDSFSDAFGGVSGNIQHSHRYQLEGTYTIQLTVVDDDGGFVRDETSVFVVTPEEAVDAIIDLVDEAIAGTADNALKRLLEGARKHLAGSATGRGENGSLDMLLKGNKNAALVKLRLALADLTAAQSLGADVGALIALLEQVQASILAE